MPVGWKVAHNGFYEVDPPSDPDADEWLSLTDDLLILTNTTRRVLLDVSWLPFGHRGRFVLSAVDWVGSPEMPDSWAAPLLQFRSRSREQIVAKLEAWLAREDWGKIKQKRQRSKGSLPLEVTYVRNQKVYEAEID